MSHIEIFARCLIGLVFCASAIGKLRGAEAFLAFERSVRDLRLLPLATIRPTARAVVGAELTVPVLVTVPYTAQAGLATTLLLLTGFTVVVVLMLRRGTPASCACFGASGAPYGRRHVVRNLVLLTVAAAGIVTPESALHPAGLAIAIVAAILASAVVVTLDELADLFASTAEQGRNQ
ncbi:hypothetical protein OHA25_07360 [Nonomuraea sp. NBC_00507]|uniref:MauE/DoxX family redox-associated membrane protein n=1 Tax=Nonomuraea sp. NBC_00507 TaxID=2976002 RepID=UPI002E18D6C3